MEYTRPRPHQSMTTGDRVSLQHGGRGIDLKLRGRSIQLPYATQTEPDGTGRTRTIWMSMLVNTVILGTVSDCKHDKLTVREDQTVTPVSHLHK